MHDKTGNSVEMGNTDLRSLLTFRYVQTMIGGKKWQTQITKSVLWA